MILQWTRNEREREIQQSYEFTLNAWDSSKNEPDDIYCEITESCLFADENVRIMKMRIWVSWKKRTKANL